MNEGEADVALLVPVQEEHLNSALAIQAEHGRVAFATNDNITLEKFKNLTADSCASVVFYVSFSNNQNARAATYRARFVACTEAMDGKAPVEWGSFRPTTTLTDSGWKGFYLVEDLQKLDQPILLATIRKRGKQDTLAPNFVPRGPLIVSTPF